MMAALVGCAKPTQFAKPDATTQALVADRAQCEAYAAKASPIPLGPDAIDPAELQPGPSAPQVLMDRSGGASLSFTPSPAYQPYYNSSLAGDFAHFLAARAARAREKRILIDCMASKGWQPLSS